jgi:outer membrane immunogenic protein
MKQFLVAVGALALFSSAAYAADLVPAPQVAAEMAAVDWSGGYVGANVGYGSGTMGLGIIGGGLGFGVATSGLFAGAQVGYNYQLRNGLVFGFEGDLNWSNETGSFSVGGGGPSISDDVDWFGAVTGHVGYAWDSIMPYALAGVAVAQNTVTVPSAPPTSASGTHVGYTVGVGVADMLTNNVSTFVELRHADYGSTDYTFAGVGGGSGSVSLADTTLRAGLNFHF